MGFGLGGVNLRQFDVNTILTIYKGDVYTIYIRMKLIFVCLNFIYIFEYAFSI